MTEHLFLEILKTAINEEKPPCEAVLSYEETDEILKTAELHRVLPLVYDKVYDFCPYNEREKEVLLKRTKLLVLQQSFREEGFLKVYGELLKNGLKPMVVKGIVCRHLYPKPEFRFSADEDLLILPNEAEAYDKVLSSLGFRKQEDFRENSYETSYFTDDGLHIELHTSLFSTKTEYFNRYNEVMKDAFDKAVCIQVGNESLYTLCPTDHFVFLLLHTLKHFINGGVGIRQICDIMLFVRQYAEEIDFKTACDRLTYTKADRFSAGVFAIGGKYLGFEKEADLYNSAKGNSLTECDDLLSDILCAGVYGGATMVRRHSAQMTWDAVHGKKKRLLHRLFPPLKELDTRFDYARKAPVLLPVAWIHRLFIYLARTDKKGVSAPLETLHLASERTELLRSLGLLDG